MKVSEYKRMEQKVFIKKSNWFFKNSIVTDEDLIKWGWPEDVWFHVDKVSSAHVYLRLAPVS